MDKLTGRIILDRVLYSGMGYPAEYGFLENTLAPDGDALDILVIATEPTYPGYIVPARVLGYLTTIDNGSLDHKLSAVIDCDPRYDEIQELSHVPSFMLEEIRNFFENYKALQNLEVTVEGYHGKAETLALVEESRKRYLEQRG